MGSGRKIDPSGDVETQHGDGDISSLVLAGDVHDQALVVAVWDWYPDAISSLCNRHSTFIEPNHLNWIRSPGALNTWNTLVIYAHLDINATVKAVCSTDTNCTDHIDASWKFRRRHSRRIEGVDACTGIGHKVEGHIWDPVDLETQVGETAGVPRETWTRPRRKQVKWVIGEEQRNAEERVPNYCIIT